MKPTRLILAVSATAALTALAPRSTLAGGFEVVQQSAVAAGTGSASTGRKNDAGSAWYNPAALADGFGLRTNLGVTFVMSALHASSQTEAPDAPWEADSDNGVSTPAYLYASYSYADWAAGVAVNTPFGSKVIWPDDWLHRFDTIHSKVQFLRLAPFFAYRIGPVRLAAGPQFDFGKVNLKKATNHIVMEGSSAMVLSGHGFGAQAAAFFELGKYVTAGFSYKSRAAVPMSGDADFNVPQPFAPDYPDQTISADWTLPDRIAWGVALDFDKFRGLLDLTLTLWSVNDVLLLDFSEEVTNDVEKINAYRDSLAIRGGVEYDPLKQLTLRAGFYGDGIPGPPPPEEYLSPSSPDCTRLGITFGVSGHFIDELSLDVFYEHLLLLERSAANADAPLANYSGHANIIGLGLRFHYFTGDPPPEEQPPPRVHGQPPGTPPPAAPPPPGPPAAAPPSPYHPLAPPGPAPAPTTPYDPATPYDRPAPPRPR